jgi:hypothetical protein
MKPTLHTLLSLACLLLVSCAAGGRTRTTTHLDGRVEKDTALYAQLGGKGGFVAQGDGGFAMQFDGEKSFGQAMTAGGTAYGIGQWAGVEKARSAATVSTTNTATKAAAATEQARIGATASTAKALGSNPEANVPAINAVGNILRRTP